MSNIAVVCAFPPDRNTGMYTVDYSAARFFAETFPAESVSFYCLGDPDRAGYDLEKRPVAYKPLHRHLDDLHAADLIVYWGDFLQSKGYWDADLCGWLVRDGIASTKAEAENLVYRALMLEDAPDAVLGRVLIFGGTIITIGAIELSDTRYRTALERMLRLAKGVYFRDAISAAKADPYRGGRSALGIDCALLLRPEDYAAADLPLPAAANSGSRLRLGVFFGRAKWIVQPLAFSRMLAKKLDAEATWVPWLGSAPRQLPLARAAGYPASSKPPLPQDIFPVLATCNFIVSDTYHLCVNAWNIGIPTICLGYGAERIAHTLGDKKKETLFSMNGAAPFYVYRESIANPTNLRSAVAHAAQMLRDSAATDIVRTSIRAQSAAAREKLLSACLAEM
ncbi:polysaccharide pyruvyl transferase family protein [Sphingomonas sp. HMP9]|uniref:polysaccharide pyruvyl transferase family protein n=1 Tax=Sphingomonas sp. HMP9 TaxID=1517554 RepID=UPI00159649F3|nr:polysaccharide pyruvyl transferase family protein [Sphingomonas sp. HMP9]